MDSLKTPPSPEARLHFLDYWRIIRLRKTVILAVFLLVVVTTVVVTYILPESFAGIAQIKIDKDQPSGSLERQSYTPYDPYFIQDQFEIIQSQKILYKVIENLDLNTAWSKKYGLQTLKTSLTYDLLKRNIDLRQIRNTSLIEIRIYSQDKEEACRIANEIADAYREYRLDKRRSEIDEGLVPLESKLQEQEKKVTAQQAVVSRLRKDLNISEMDATGNAPSPTIETETLRRLEAQRIEVEAKYVKEAELLSKLKTLSRDVLKNVIPTAAPDPLLHDYLLKLNIAETELARLKSDLGAEHPDVLRAVDTITKLNQQISDRINGTLVGLQANVDSDKAWLNRLQEEVATARTTDQEKASKSAPYYEAKLKLEELQRFRYLLSQKIALETVERERPTTTTEAVNRAEPTYLKPVRPNKPLNIALGVIIGLIVGVGLAFFIEYLDTSVKTIDDVERALQSPVLGVIPQNVGRLLDEGAESPHAEAYRVLRTNLLFSRKGENLNSLAVVSAGAGEGKSTTVFNLATTFAQSGQRVLVVDSDLRRPSLHKFLRVSNNLGLTNYLLKQNTLEEVIQRSELPTLDFLPSGKLPSSSMGILSSAAMKSLIHELKQRYDFVFFDSPPIMGVSDASILASEVDMTIQVIQYRRYPQPMNIRAKQTIEKVGGNLIGIVLNNINMSQDESYYYYSGYYHEYYSKNEENNGAAEGGASDRKKPRLDIKRNS